MESKFELQAAPTSPKGEVKDEARPVTDLPKSAGLCAGLLLRHAASSHAHICPVRSLLNSTALRA
eukprot:559608-Pelagomonas_calceolata.AAC.9